MVGSVTNRISDLLSQRGMSQKELAQKAGLTESAISHYIKGDRVPRGVNLVKIARALDTSTDFLLNSNESSSREEELKVAKTLIARNAAQMTKKEKMELVSMLISEE